MLFGKTERLEGDIDRTEELVLLNSVVTPNGHLRSKEGKSHAKKKRLLILWFSFYYLQKALLYTLKWHTVHQHFHKRGVNIAANDARFTLGDLMHVWQ